ncbi:hypothetical protein LVJ94_46150 [Pendulispora rubella]|uniref:Uncharacterized protein n=1 Tax=Pendulispora rubella TaxID=2741070 RepID=A0ABZ2L4Z6_9BACT
MPAAPAAVTFLYELAGTTCVIVHGEPTPSDDEWEVFLGVFGKHAAAGTMTKVLVFKEGSGPNPRQRARFLEVAKEYFRRSVPTAVLCPPGQPEGVSTAVGWFHQRHATYGPTELTRALDFLELRGKERDVVADRLASLRERLAKLRRPTPR